MITIKKLRSLKNTTALRKCAYIIQEAGVAARSGKSVEIQYTSQILDLVLELKAVSAGTDPETDFYYIQKVESIREQLHASESMLLGWYLEDLHYRILSDLGVSTADWDITDAEGNLQVDKRVILPIRAYLDRVRSPYNVGSLFRTAESYCCDSMILAPDTAAPDHPRAERTARGCIDVIPWRTVEVCGLDDMLEGPFFALELGGTPLDAFPFPQTGTVIVGSEELGVSPEDLPWQTAVLEELQSQRSGARGH